MIKNGKGGGNTKTGLIFEGKTDLATFLNVQPGIVLLMALFFTTTRRLPEFSKNMGFTDI